MSFRDHRGTGGVFRMMPVRAVTAEQLGLSREIQSLAIEPEGLVLVAGPRSSGKRTLLSALVDLINRVRRDHVITIEKEINVVHERIGSFISQREVHGGSDELLVVARAALREDPDVLVLEELRSAAVMNLALDAASSGQLVIGGLPAPDAAGAIDRIIDLYPPEYRRQVQLSLAQNLRGVVSQVLLRKTGGGRLAAREVLMNTPAVRSILAEGKTSQLPLAIEGGRAHGMVPLNDWLVGYVQSGAVDVREAYRRAVDRAGFLALLKRQGLDTSAIERFGVARIPRVSRDPELSRLTFRQLETSDFLYFSTNGSSSFKRKPSTCCSVRFRTGPSATGRSDSRTRRPRARRLWPMTIGSSPVVSSVISMKSSAFFSDMSRTLPPGVNTSNGYPCTFRTLATCLKRGMATCSRNTTNSRDASSTCVRRSTAARFARSIVSVRCRLTSEISIRRPSWRANRRPRGR